jgi:Kdo2-lipid IVA lauroyltransferase/acyltransferase
MVRGISKVLSYIWFDLLRIRRRVAEENVKRVFGEKLGPSASQKMLRRSFQMAILYVFELLRTPYRGKAAVQERVTIVNRHHITDALSQGRGCILLTAHIGCMDLAGMAVAFSGLPVVIVVRKVSWALADLWLTKVRQWGELTRLPDSKVGFGVVRALKKNQCVVLVCDQHMTPKHGIPTLFFDQPASTTPAPARLALLNQTPIVPMLCTRQGLSERIQLQLLGPRSLETPHAHQARNIRHITETLNRLVEKWVLAHPDQWLWVHRRWKIQDQWEKWSTHDFEAKPKVETPAVEDGA